MKILLYLLPKVLAYIYQGNCVLEKEKYLYLPQIIDQGFGFVLISRDPECHYLPTPQPIPTQSRTLSMEIQW